MATPHPDRPPTLAERGTPPPKSSPDDSGPGSPARRRRMGPLGLAVVMILAGLSLMLMIAPAGIVLVAAGIGIGLWGGLRAASDPSAATSKRR